MTSGILLLDKPLGLTSNAALSRAKRVLGIRKAGHTGALDPLATGLLPLCFGQATKVSAFLLDADKGYKADIMLGVTTASGDAEGDPIATQDVPNLKRCEIEAVLQNFRGPIDQVPPMYSALKHHGKRLHELARAGIEVERKARPVTIYRLDLLAVELPRLSVRVRCSKGTYIRSLAADIGEQIGCGAHLSALRRESSGPFSLDASISLERLEHFDAKAARALLLPPDSALPGLGRIELDAESATDIGHGKVVATQKPAAELIRMYFGGRFLGLGTIDGTGRLRSRRLFVPEVHA
ncbi:MAG: tRNA pseudouridine(55) synthase TruB [Xanthomonadaceae bacterium]|nr:tRNA pseudouridine(55) synthase TruB [Xanthomonadaceae bacterium]